VQRIKLPARMDWRAQVEEQGLTWHTAPDGTPYWDESAYWLFTAAEIDRIEAATDELYTMVLAAVGKVIEGGQLADFGYPPETIPLIEASWRVSDDQPSLYARFDLAFDGHDLKMLEVNGDTPTSLLEAAVVQWNWLEDRFPHLDQFNSIHEKLIAAFKGQSPGLIHFTSAAPHDEDQGTVAYIAACAAEGGLTSAYVAQQDIGFIDGDGFVDLEDRPITRLFKLIPWEWWLDDQFGEVLAGEAIAERIEIMEPAWKMVASNKQLLVTLAQMYPGHPLLLDAATHPRSDWTAWVRKPVRGREGANVEIVEAGVPVAGTDGVYEDDLFIYQQRATLAQADGRYAVLGSWVVDGAACGMGIRESDGPITGNLARFVPHVLG
jgi:glutathionylspermidine synthase